MTVKERYQQCLDDAYLSAPFELLGVLDTKAPDYPLHFKFCQVCANKQVRYLCKAKDKEGNTWYIGRDCWTELYNRQFQDEL